MVTQQAMTNEGCEDETEWKSCICICNSLKCVCCVKNNSEDDKKYYEETWVNHGCQLLVHPLKDKYVGSVIATYFSFVHHFFVWLFIMFGIGLLFFAASFYTIHEDINPANPVCGADFSDFYMCPLCDGSCDFWYLKIYLLQQRECTRRYRLLVDNPVMWVYCALVLFSALSLSFIMLCRNIASHTKESQSHAEVISNPGTIGASQLESPNGSPIPVGCSRPPVASPNGNPIPVGYSLPPETAGASHPGDKCYVIILLWIGTIVVVCISLILFFLFFLFSLWVEKRTRRNILNTLNISNDIIVFLILGLLAIVQGVLNLILKCIYENTVHYSGILSNTVHCSGIFSNKVHHFFIFLIYNGFLAYFPILFKIFLYGQITGDPEVGYNGLGELRFQHCPTYGCIDVGLFIFFIMLISFGGSPSFNLLKKIIWHDNNRVCHSNKSNNNNNSNDSNNECKSSKCSIGTIIKFSFTRSNVDIVDHYVVLSIFYGYIVFFLTAAGVFPFIAAMITLPIITRYSSMYYAKILKPYRSFEDAIKCLEARTKEVGSANEECKQDVKMHEQLKTIKESSVIEKVWMCVFFSMTLFAMFTNVAIVIPNSRFIQHIAYSTSTGHFGPLLNFDGYLDAVFPKHDLTKLIQSGIFPDYNAHHLTMLYPNGKTVRNNAGKPILYLPFIDFQCLKKKSHYSGNNFTREGYIKYMSSRPTTNKIIKYNSNKQAIAKGECFVETASCRSRGILQSNPIYNHINFIRRLFVIGFVIPFLVLIVIPIFIIVLWKKCNK